MKDIEASSEKYSDNPSWTEDILEHRRRQFTTERGFRFADYHFSRQKDAVARYSHFDKHIFEDLKGTYTCLLKEIIVLKSECGGWVELF